MKNALHLLTLLSLFLSLGCIASGETGAQKAESTTQIPESLDSDVAEMKQLLESVPATRTLFPEFEATTPEALTATPGGTAVLAWAREAANETLIPETTYTLYRMFKKTGDRDGFQKPFSEKRSLLAQEALAVLLGGDTARADRLNDLIWSVCEESSWVLPAHEKTDHYIDLTAAGTGAMLAQVSACLGDHLPEEIHQRIGRELKRRIFDPYLEHGEEYGWNRGYNNWTGVCAGAIGQAFLLMETDPDRQARALALAVRQLKRFIERGFNTDGACLEGIGYWNYGLSEYVIFAEMLRARTAGKIDLLTAEKMKLIARYPTAVYLGKGTYASFSDSHESGSITPYLAGRIADRTGVADLKLLASDSPVGSLHTALRNLLWASEKEPGDFTVTDVFLPESGLVKMTVPTSGHNLVLAAKAGHNAEPHNNNDVGSFVLAVDGIVYLCDPGAGLYNRDYFSGKRYDSIFANSYGHSVPRIGGELQKTGPNFKGALERTGQKSAIIRFEQAYGLSELSEAIRSITVGETGVTLEDQFQFTGEGLPVEETLMTWQQVELNGATARIRTDMGILEIKVDSGEFAVENLEDICRVNKKSGVLKRITVMKPAASETTSRFEMTFHPNP